MELKSKIAIVTGASKGLGAAISRSLVKEGVRVFGLARRRDELIKLQGELGEKFIPITLNLTNSSDVKAWLKNQFSENQAPDILINNAGIGSFGKFDEMPSEEWHSMINTNLNGMYTITNEVVRMMKKLQISGHIINIGSILGITTRSEGAAYSATKYAINGFSESLFKELRSFGIKVSCVNPGSIESGFFSTSGISAHPNMLQPKELADTIVHILKTPDNMLISEITIRPLDPRAPE